MVRFAAGLKQLACWPGSWLCCGAQKICGEISKVSDPPPPMAVLRRICWLSPIATAVLSQQRERLLCARL